MTETRPLHPELRGATYNVYRENEKAPSFVERMCGKHDLDFLLLQEIHHMRRELAAIEGYYLVSPNGPEKGDEHNGILVRRGVTADWRQAFRMSRRGWFTRSGKRHAPSYATVCVLDGWLRTMSVHAPVSVNWRGPGSRPTGPELRVRAYKDHSRRALTFARQGERQRSRGRRTLMGGDWNANLFRNDTGRWSAMWIARKVKGLQIFHPERFGRGHNGIDYLLSDGDVTDVEREEWTGGSDHPFITFTVRP